MHKTGHSRDLTGILRKRFPVIAVIILGLFVLTAAAAAYDELPVVSDPSDQVNQSIDGQIVVWQDYRNKSFGCPNGANCTAADIYTLNLTTGIEQRLTTATNGMDPDISGNRVVWRNWSTGKIIVHDLTTGIQTNASLQGGTVQMVTPSISGDIVVWTDYRASSDYGEIYMRDLNLTADGPVSQSPTDPAIPVVKKDKRDADIDGNIVVWVDWRNASQDQWGWWSNPDIYMKDLSTGVEQPVTMDTADQYMPVVSGNRVLWMDHRNGNWDVYMKDISNAANPEVRLTNDNADQSWPSIDGDFVAWKDTRNGNEDIYRLHLGTGIEEIITTDIAPQKIPVVSGSIVTWMDQRAGNWDIYYAGESACTSPGLSLSVPVPYWASMADYTAGILSVDWSLSNPGENTAYNINIIGSSSTNGVSLISALPAVIGDLGGGGGSGAFTFQYYVPPGAVSFKTTTYVNAGDICGNSYAYPGPFPGA